jgi:hypothetical protein
MPGFGDAKIPRLFVEKACTIRSKTVNKRDEIENNREKVVYFPVRQFERARKLGRAAHRETPQGMSPPQRHGDISKQFLKNDCNFVSRLYNQRPLVFPHDPVSTFRSIAREIAPHVLASFPASFPATSSPVLEVATVRATRSENHAGRRLEYFGRERYRAIRR